METYKDGIHFMKLVSSLLALTFLALCIGGCASTSRSAKQQVDKQQLSRKNLSQEFEPGSKKPEVKPDELIPTSDIEKNSPNPGSDPGIDRREKAEITASAMDFTKKNVPGVIHVQVCYSKLYGGWYMLTYVQKGKRISKQHWSWNSKLSEWEVVSHLKDLTPKELEEDLSAELPGEKCFLVK